MCNKKCDKLYIIDNNSLLELDDDLKEAYFGDGNRYD